MRAVFNIGYENHPEEWIEKSRLFELIEAASEEEALAHYRRVRDEIRAFVADLERLVASDRPQLRRVLGDDARTPRFIETIRKGGYRLVTPVDVGGARTTSARWNPRGHGARTVAVLLMVVLGTVLAFCMCFISILLPAPSWPFPRLRLSGGVLGNIPGLLTGEAFTSR